MYSPSWSGAGLHIAQLHVSVTGVSVTVSHFFVHGSSWTGSFFSTRSLAGEMEEKVSRVVCVEQSAFFETLFRERVPQLPCSDFLQMLKANFFFNENARETMQAI